MTVLLQVLWTHKVARANNLQRNPHPLDSWKTVSDWFELLHPIQSSV